MAKENGQMKAKMQEEKQPVVEQAVKKVEGGGWGIRDQLLGAERKREMLTETLNGKQIFYTCFYLHWE